MGTIREALSESCARLEARGRGVSEAEECVMAALGIRGRAELALRGAEAMEAEPAARLELCLRACESGLPLQYATGRQQFLDHFYRVAPGVLIPRPETEVLARAAMERLGLLGGARGARGLELGFEIGVGSGVLSIELLARFPGLEMVATEASEIAMGLARENAEAILDAPDRLEIFRVRDPSLICQPLVAIAESRGQAGFIVSNPPYLADESEADALVVASEPGIALFPGGDPLRFYREIARELPKLVMPGGFCFLELPHSRAREIAGLFGSLGQAEILPDLTGRPRVLVVILRQGG